MRCIPVERESPNLHGRLRFVNDLPHRELEGLATHFRSLGRDPIHVPPRYECVECGGIFPPLPG